MKTLISAIAGLLAVATAADAGPSGLSDPVDQVNISSEFFHGVYQSGAGDVAATSSYGIPGLYTDAASASVSLAPQPTVTVSVSGSGVLATHDGPRAFASSEYYIQINGPADIDVPLVVASEFTSSFSLTSDYGFTAGMSVSDRGAGPVNTGFIGYGVGDNGQPHPSFSFDETGEFESNVPIQVELSALVVYLYSGAETSFGSSLSVDPLVAIDPVFLRQNPGYSLSFSDGVGNSGPAPEPATWALTLVGVAGVGVLLRRKAGSRSAPAPAA